MEIIPPRLDEIAKELDGRLALSAKVGTDLYAPIFADPTGLAVGITLQFARSADGQRNMPQRFVVANEAQEQVLKSLLIFSRHSEIVRAWEHGGIDGAIQFAQAQLEKNGLLGWPVRNLPRDLSGLLAQIREISSLLEAGDYDEVFASRVAQKVFDLFV